MLTGTKAHEEDILSRLTYQIKAQNPDSSGFMAGESIVKKIPSRFMSRWWLDTIWWTIPAAPVPPEDRELLATCLLGLGSTATVFLRKGGRRGRYIPKH